jgi:hypothetical protein
MKIDLGFQKFLGGMHIQTHRQKGDLISLLLFFKTRKIG